MLKISKLADYAIVIMDHLARTSGHFSASQLAELTRLSVPTTSKVLKLLQEAGLLTSERGVRGGYQLAKSAQEINVAEMISAVDGRPAMTECGHNHSQCERESVCGVKGNWQLINKMVYAVLANLSLEDMTKPLSQPLQFYKKSNEA